jgi:uroporphyrinogen-III synthase
MDARDLHGVKIAAVGPSTAAAVQTLGLRPDLVPREFVAEAIVAEFQDRGITPRRVLALRSDIGREALADGLRKMGAQVDEVVAYQTKAPNDSGKQARSAYRAEDGGIDYTTFTSSSGVKNLVDLLDGDPALINSSTVVCMGPVTAAKARELGVRVDLMAAEQTIYGLVQAVLDHASKTEMRR